MASSTVHETLTVALGERSYPIHIGADLLTQTGALLKENFAPKRCIIVSDENVAPLYAETVATSLEAEAIQHHRFTLPAGEATKSFAQLQALLESILALSPDRQTAIIALGGGVVGDIAGFTASILLRGVPFVQIPTSLLAQVDSSVGGKTGINSSHGKNLIGSFYQPKMVLIDTETLRTLPPRELRAGFAEVVKYGCIHDAAFLRWLEEHGTALLAGDAAHLTHAIRTSCAIKAEIVSQDEREAGKRALLNFGHSFGHALEQVCGYDGRLLHGEAVAIGMVMALDYSARTGQCSPEDKTRLAALLRQHNLPITAKHLGLQQKLDPILQAMQKDKKNEQQGLTLILTHQPGQAHIAKAIPVDDILQNLWADYL
jgi:3-dehydroquinate synthase